MKRFLKILLLCIFIFGCAGCGSASVNDQLRVSIMDTDGVSVAENGLLVSPGEDAVFNLEIRKGAALVATDYPGDYRVIESDEGVILTLYQVDFPTRVRLTVTDKNCAIDYHANGGTGIDGAGQQLSISYDLRNHARPNTAIGTDLFRREGHTLVSWNTMPDGSGERIGLGSRVTVTPGGSLTLYAQWEPWSDPGDFTAVLTEEGMTITAYRGTDPRVVIPESIDGSPVTAIAAGAFTDCAAESVVFPKTMRNVEPGAFRNCALKSVTLFDNIVSIGDDGFQNCRDLQTLYINAIEAPYGYLYRRESVYADKVDLLIQARGQRKMVFYGGCSMWYNLDGGAMQEALGSDYQVINMGLNGTVSSLVQMRILENFLEPGDIFFHTPELSSRPQLFLTRDMGKDDEVLWSGLEYNFDLFAMVDIRDFTGVFDSLTDYLSRKKAGGSYLDCYTDSDDNVYLDSTGSIPFFRSYTFEELEDKVYLNPDYIDPQAMAYLEAEYDKLQARGVRIYVSYACVNMDEVPEEQQGNVAQMDELFRAAIEEMDGPVLISRLGDFLFRRDDFYDTNYHLRSDQASRNTEVWIRDLLAQLEKDGLWEDKR